MDVRASRPLSLAIAARSGVPHESPQVILFRSGVPVWSASHHDISVEALERFAPAV